MNLCSRLLVVVIAGAMTVTCSSRTGTPTAPTRGDSGGVPSGPITGGPVPAPLPPPTTANCDAVKAQFAVGERASQDLLERARVAAGAGAARFIRLNEPVTMDFSPSRLNLKLNARDVVRSTYCG